MSECNLEGKTVKFYVYDEQDEKEGVQRDKNNYTNTCPAIVLGDWSTGTQNMTAKCLNLQVFPDCNEPFQVTSAMHVEASGFYPLSAEEEAEGVIANRVKKNCWELY
jgi:hypothetical protein